MIEPDPIVKAEPVIREKTDKFVLISFIFTFLSFIPVCCVLALVFGILALKQNRRFYLRAFMACCFGGFFTALYALTIIGAVLPRSHVPDDPPVPLASESVAEVIGRLFSIVVTPGPDVGASAPFVGVRDGVFQGVEQGRVGLVQGGIRAAVKIVDTQSAHPEPAEEDGEEVDGKPILLRVSPVVVDEMGPTRMSWFRPGFWKWYGSCLEINSRR